MKREGRERNRVRSISATLLHARTSRKRRTTRRRRSRRRVEGLKRSEPPASVKRVSQIEEATRRKSNVFQGFCGEGRGGELM